MVEINLDGMNRIVFLTKRYAFKIPNVRSFYQTLWGMIDGMHERWANGIGVRAHPCRQEGICPVLFSLPLGLLIVMPRARPLTDDEWVVFDSVAFRNRGSYWISAEDKSDSFGVLNGEIVAIDYGH